MGYNNKKKLIDIWKRKRLRPIFGWKNVPMIWERRKNSVLYDLFHGPKVKAERVRWMGLYSYLVMRD